MANDYYDHQNYPSQGSAGSSSALRAELDSIEAGFEKLPVLAGNGNKVVAVNSAGTALESIPGSSITGIALGNTIGTLALNRGGTGATSAAAALTALGASTSTLVSTGNVLGAVNLANPGGTTRSLTQWNGASYAGFTLGASAFQAPYLYTSLSACYFGVDAGGGNPGVSFDTGDYMDYNRTSNSWRLVIGGAELVTASAVDFVISTPAFVHRFAGNATKFTFNTSAPLDQKYWSEIAGPSQIVKYMYNDSFSVANPYDIVNRVGANLTTRRLNESGGRLLVGQGLTDDGVTALQTTSYSASDQPSLVGGTGLNIVATPFTLVELTFGGIFKGGMATNGMSKRLTVPVAGVYLVTASVGFAAGNSKGKAFLTVFKNDAPQYNEMVEVVTVNTAYSIPFSMQVSMLPNDYLTLGIYNEPITSVNAQSRIQHLSVTKIN